jgi:hypothetical protein
LLWVLFYFNDPPQPKILTQSASFLVNIRIEAVTSE